MNSEVEEQQTCI